MENVNEQKETMKNKISNFFEESSVPPTISATASEAIPLAVVNKYLKRIFQSLSRQQVIHNERKSV